MIEEIFGDDERRLLIVLATEAMARIQYDTELGYAVKELHGIISKLAGTDTVIIARRAYASHGLRLTPDQARDRARSTYHDPRFAPRECDRCCKSYTGPAVYCSLECAEADA